MKRCLKPSRAVPVCLQMRTARGEMRCAQWEITYLFASFNQQGDNKKMEDAKCYLTLPCTKTEMEEKEAPSGKNLHPLANFTPTKDSTKDSFQIATLICSTKLTQNGRSCSSSPAVSCCISAVKRALSFCKFVGVAACVGIMLELQFCWFVCQWQPNPSIVAITLPVQDTKMSMKPLETMSHEYFIQTTSV